jgi:hypothetical protein
MKYESTYIPPPVKPRGLLGLSYWEWAGVVALSIVVLAFAIGLTWVADIFYHPWRYNS